ncbi:flagellar hook-associated protein FlgL [Thiocystis violacea]|uniref:flagellar hook-associated protein FlgL n=1 Tax=Thiocystis violacea TaxID=13725 RepID=UPI0019041691|nr:flagellar hook-associated protein FlgL [Thiocystis violacea]MBK1716746.1 flagellar hook-associated protein 3 [Thiocystis violacea]
MRISTSQLFQSGVSSMQRAQVDLNHTSLQMATGRRILTPSDDPSGATQSVMLQAAIGATEQHQRNVTLAQPKLEQEESQIDAADTKLQRVRELVLTGNNATYNASDRKTMASEIRQLRDDILALANTQDANGEYLFAGTRSLEKPFVENAAGRVSYVGADGVGAVRQVAVSATRDIPIGDTGQSVFMDIPEKSGLVVEGGIPPSNTGDLVVQRAEIKDYDEYALDPTASFSIQFTDNAGTMEYAVYDDADPPNAVLDDDTGLPITGTYQSDMPIEFAGRAITLTGTGTPDTGDEVIVRPAPTVSLFDTLDAIATALEAPVSDEAGRERLAEASSTALLNIDSSNGRLNEIRTSVGLRLGALDTQTDINSQRQLDLETTLSEVRDLDYAEAISRFKLQEVVLQAAQQTYVQVSRLSLFDFL